MGKKSKNREGDRRDRIEKEREGDKRDGERIGERGR